ncbi:MAG: VTT domain-containing protein [Saprospiraceae bacterium]|nr:VTT domain-containing protein [Saprospiraceae bacterium]
MDPQPAPTLQPNHTLRSILIILIVIGISILVYIGRDWLRNLGVLGYPGLFLVGLLASAAMFVPMPGLLVLAAAPSVMVLDPFWAGMVFAAGASLGEMSGYFAGFAGQGTVQRSKWVDRMEYWMKKYGGVTLLVLGFIPNVLIDVAGLVAGALKMPWYKFLFWCFLGKVPKCLLVAYGGMAFMKAFL